MWVKNLLDESDRQKGKSKCSWSYQPLAGLSWFSIRIEGMDMERINTAYFYLLGQKLIPLRNLQPSSTVLSAYGVLYGAHEELRGFLVNTLLPPVTCFNTGKSLYEMLLTFLNDPAREAPLEWMELNALKEALTAFEVSLQSDFQVRDTFIVSPKGTHSTTILSSYGERMVAKETLALVSSMTQDLQDAGRCIAFELPTAAAFHLFRAVEAMARGYGEFVRGKPFSKLEQKNGLGGYANFLKEKVLAVDERITGAIAQVASLHRNPTMHPEMHISKSEIMATQGMVVSVIETLAIDWKRRVDMPTVPLVDILPDDSKVTALLGDGNENSHSGAGEIQLGHAKTFKRLKGRVAKKTGARQAAAG